MEEVKAKLKAFWDKAVSAVKSNKAVFIYGLIVGGFVGAIIW